VENRKRIGILTGGGDCPGLNAAIRAVTKTAIQFGFEVIGIQNGWKGLINNENETLDGIKTSGIIDRGGTILGTSRISPFKIENGPQLVLDKFKELGLEGLVVLGGEGTLTVTSRLFEMGLSVVGIPKTIDNDVKGTDFSIGFQTAVEIATDALDRLRSTGESHHRVMILEVMGHHAGWIATYSGIANGADAILIPEFPLDQEKIEGLCQMLKRRNERGINFSIVVVAEGTKLEGEAIADEKTGRLGGIGKLLGKIIEEKTGLETRVSSLDYMQRGGAPVAYDRTLATAFGVRAFELIKNKKYGRMVSLHGDRITDVPLAQAAGGIKTVNLNIYRVAEKFFG